MDIINPNQQTVQPVNAQYPQVVQQPVDTVNVQPTMQQAMANVQQEAVTVEHVDPNVVTLSTGVVVRFHRLRKSISDEFVTTIFSETELDSKNNIRVDSNDRNEQIRLATKFMDLNTSILGSGGVELLSELPPEEQWLDQILYAPTIMQKYSHINPQKLTDKDKIFLFLRYFAFNDDDLTLLSELCLNQGD